MTFTQRRNRLTTHFSEWIPVKRRINVHRHLYGLTVAYYTYMESMRRSHVDQVSDTLQCVRLCERHCWTFQAAEIWHRVLGPVFPFSPNDIIAFSTEICILSTIAKLRKATISFVVPVRPSVRIEQLGFHCTDFHEIWYLIIFRKYVEKIQVSLKSARINGTVRGDQCTLLIIFHSLLLRMRNVSDKNYREIKTHILH